DSSSSSATFIIASTTSGEIGPTRVGISRSVSSSKYRFGRSARPRRRALESAIAEAQASRVHESRASDHGKMEARAVNDSRGPAPALNCRALSSGEPTSSACGPALGVASAAEEQVALACVARERSGLIERGTGLGVAAQLREQVAAHGREEM